MRIRQDREGMWLNITPNMRIPFTGVFVALVDHVTLYDKDVMTCVLWDDDARTFNMLYKEFTSRTGGE